MAGVRKKPLSGGKYQGWFLDFRGKRKFFSGTHSRRETLQLARHMEDEQTQIRLGCRPQPNSAAKHGTRLWTEVLEEYLAWGKAQGGRNGRPWSEKYAARTKQRLAWWQKRLELEVLADLGGILPKVEKNLRDVIGKGRTGKTVNEHGAMLSTFCNWAVKRGYLLENPLKNLVAFKSTARFVRRALTIDEIQRLLEVAPPERQLLYEVALTTGLRAGELRSLTVDDLDLQHCGLLLGAEWTKNRKPGFQPLPSALLERLGAFVKAGTASLLYETRSKEVPENPLLFVPLHTYRILDKDLETAGIKKYALGGKIDFHSLRTTFVTLTIEAGANVKEAQTLARHSTPNLTMNVYARTREPRLAGLSEGIRALYVHNRESRKSPSTTTPYREAAYGG